MTNEELFDKLNSLVNPNNGIEEYLKKEGYYHDINGVFKQKEELKSLMSEIERLKKDLSEVELDIDINLNTEKYEKEVDNLKKKIDTLKNKGVLSPEEYTQLQDYEDELNARENAIYRAKSQNIDYLREKGKKAYEELLKNQRDYNALLRDEHTFISYISNKLEKNVKGLNQIKAGISEVKMGTQQFLSASMKFLDPWIKLDNASANFARNIGLSSKNYEAFREQVITTNVRNRISALTTVSTEEQIENLGQYQIGIGRQTGFDDTQMFDLSAGQKLLGKEQALAYAQAFENFGLTVDSAMGKAADLFKSTANSGIAMSKASKVLLDNIKLAQTYTFKNGIDGLAEMAKRSAEIKMSLNEVTRFADKISTLEGSMQAAAGLSVLGGTFAMNANPLQMLYSGLNDFEGVSKIMENMLNGLVRFNQVTHQLEMSAFDRQRLRQASSVMGVNFDAMVEQAFAKGRENIVAPIVRNVGRSLGFNEESEEYQMLINRAYLNKQGRAMINVGDTKKTVESLTAEDIEILKRNNFSDSDNIRTIVTTLRSWDDLLKGTKEGIRANMASYAEVSGIGQTAKTILNIGNENTKFLAMIYTAVLGLTAIVGMASAAHGIFGAAKGLSQGGTGAIGKAASTMGKVMKGAAVAGVAGLGLNYLGNKALSEGSTSALATASSVGGNMLTYGSSGAMLGSVFGMPGAIIGGVLGAGYGAYSSWSDAQRQRLLNIIGKDKDFKFYGDLSKYNTSELSTIMKGGEAILNDADLTKKLIENDGYTREDILGIKRVEGYKEGGFVHGKGTINSDSNLAFLSDKEFVMPARQATKPFNANILELMRNGADFTGGIKPIGNTMGILKINKPSGADQFNNSADQFNRNLQPISIKPIDISGTIKLVLNGSTRDLNARELLDNQVFMKNLTDIVAKNLNKQQNFGYDKNEFYRKF